MLAEQRHSKIIEFLNKDGVVRTASLARTFNVSSETIRKDLDILESKGCLSKVHGGAIMHKVAEACTPQPYIKFETRNTQNTDHKDSIAKCAVQFVHEGQSIALDNGTSAFAMANTLKNKFERLTIVTNSMKIASTLADKHGFTVILTGGIMMPDEYSCVSDFATLIIERVNIDVMFLTVSGISVDSGLTDQRIEEIYIQKKMIASSRKVVVLADSSKFGETSFVSVCGLNEVDTFVTDNNINPIVAGQLREKNCEIVIA